MNVLSLFDGMCCGMLAFNGADIKVDNYYAYEIDKYAIKTALHNFPNKILEYGDVFKADFKQHKDIDFLIGGSPCTYWSIAQKNNRETEASGMGWELFLQYVRALKEVKPRYFIYENNKSMSNQIRESISNCFGFEPVMIDSALVSAQKRQRLYWVGKRVDDKYAKVDVPLPRDRGLILKDFLLSCEEPINISNEGKSQTIKAQYQQTSPVNICCYSSTYGATGVAEPVRVDALPRPNGELSTSQAFRIYSTKGKSVTLKSNAGGAGAKTGLYALSCDKSNKEYTVYDVKDKTIIINNKPYPINLKDGYYIIRKLSVSECKRLQTVPDTYRFPVSDRQAYIMLGNGWTIKVIEHLIKCCLK